MSEREIIIKAIEKLMKNDTYLLEININERTLTHRLAIYLEELYQDQDYHVDCEYNRIGDIPKTLKNYNLETNAYDLRATTVYPDIIIHKRGKQKNNFIIIEVKKSSENNEDLIKRDKQKLEEYKKQLGYLHAFFIVIPVGEDIKNNNYLKNIEEI